MMQGAAPGRVAASRASSQDQAAWERRLQTSTGGMVSRELVAFHRRSAQAATGGAQRSSMGTRVCIPPNAAAA
jgi:hypothetical protein